MQCLLLQLFFFFLLNRKVKAATFVPSGLYMVQFTPSYCTAMPLWIYALVRSTFFWENLILTTARISRRYAHH
ncbi:hypothetical protein CPB85DRAFT_1308627, partial [Mucidula mucida]